MCVIDIIDMSFFGGGMFCVFFAQIELRKEPRLTNDMSDDDDDDDDDQKNKEFAATTSKTSKQPSEDETRKDSSQYNNNNNVFSNEPDDNGGSSGGSINTNKRKAETDLVSSRVPQKSPRLFL